MEQKYLIYRSGNLDLVAAHPVIVNNTVSVIRWADTPTIADASEQIEWPLQDFLNTHTNTGVEAPNLLMAQKYCLSAIRYVTQHSELFYFAHTGKKCACILREDYDTAEPWQRCLELLRCYSVKEAEQVERARNADYAYEYAD